MGGNNKSSVQEILADLRDCNVDHGIASQRLLARDDGLAVNCEDTLQEVEWKHGKGKEPIEKMQDIGTSDVSDHGSRTAGNLNVGHADPVQISSYDYWNLSSRSKEQAADSDAVDVLIPDHLRVSNTEFPDLTFGSLRFETGSAFSAALAFDTLKGAGSIAATSGASVGHLDTRNAQHHNDNQHVSTVAAHQADLRAGNNDSHSSSNVELPRPNNHEAIPGHVYYSSAPDYVFRNRQQAMQQLQPSAFSSGINPGVPQSGVSFVAQPIPQNLAGSSAATGPPFCRPFPELHFQGQDADIARYLQILRYSSMPPALQQEYHSSSPFHQLATGRRSTGMQYDFPQIEIRLPVGSLHQYNNTSCHPEGLARYPLSQPLSSRRTTRSHDDVLIGSQLGDQHTAFQRRDNPAMLFDGYGLRSSPTVPRNAYDILQARNLLEAAYWQYQASDNQRRSMGKPR